MHYILISFILHTQCTRPVNTLDDVVFEQLVTCTQQTQFWCKEARALSPRHIGNGQLGTPALCVCVLYSHYRVKIQLCAWLLALIWFSKCQATLAVQDHRTCRRHSLRGWHRNLGRLVEMNKIATLSSWEKHLFKTKELPLLPVIPSWLSVLASAWVGVSLWPVCWAMQVQKLLRCCCCWVVQLGTKGQSMPDSTW